MWQCLFLYKLLAASLHTVPVHSSAIHSHRQAWLIQYNNLHRQKRCHIADNHH